MRLYADAAQSLVHRIAAAIAALGVAMAPLAATACCDPAGPFRMGEELPSTPARCDTLADWAEKAPETADRVSFALTGRITAAESDGALVYLTLCAAPAIQAICVTYPPQEHAVGDEVTVAGGYIRAAPEIIVLDPCLPVPVAAAAGAAQG